MTCWLDSITSRRPPTTELRRSVRCAFSRAFAGAFACSLAVGVALCLPAQHTLAFGEAPHRLFDHAELLTLQLTAPFNKVTKDRHGKSTYHPAQLSYRDGDGQEVVLPVEIRARGKTRRRKDFCAFPPLRIRFGDNAADSAFAGQRTLKLVTHCNDKDSFDQYVVKEYLAYRIYNQLTERGHRVRLARLTYQEARGRLLTTRYGILLEDWRAVAARNDLVAEEVDGGVNIDKLSSVDANRVALFQYLIGNQDWSVLWPEPHEGCCHNTKPLLARDGTVMPLPYDFDFSGIVNTPYAVSKGGGPNVRFRRFGGLCAMAAEIPDALPQFEQQREAIYALFREQPELNARHRKSSLSYLDGFYRVIGDPAKVERQMIRRCKTD